ncbi:MAG: hypothetical protein ABIP49_09765, partial [Lysobacterales bacterium]
FIFFGIGGYFIQTGSTVSGSDGQYTLGIDSPQYLVSGGNGFGLRAYPAQRCFTPQCPDASTQTVSVPSQNANFTLERVGSILGTVALANGGAPITSGVVRLRTFETSLILTAGIQPDGSFAFYDLHPMSYVLAAQPADPLLLERAYPDRDLDAVDTFEASSLFQLTLLPVAENQIVTVALEVNESACFEGFVRNSPDVGTPPPMDVSVRRMSPQPANGFSPVALDRAGAYRVSRLKPGSYRISFANLDLPNAYRPNYYPNSETEFGSTTVALAPGVCASAVDADVVPRYSLAGLVRSAATGLPLAGVPVSAEYVINLIPSPFGIVTHTDSNGRFLSTGFPLITQAVRARPSRGYAGEAFREQDYCCNAGSWEDVTVVDGQHRDALDFTIDPAPYVSGRVFNRPSRPDVSVRLLRSNSTQTDPYPVAADGSYFTTGQASGSGPFRVVLQVGNQEWVHPGIRCPAGGCSLVPQATEITLSELREYPGFDFVIDEVHANGFE